MISLTESRNFTYDFDRVFHVIKILYNINSFSKIEEHYDLFSLSHSFKLRGKHFIYALWCNSASPCWLFVLHLLLCLVICLFHQTINYIQQSHIAPALAGRRYFLPVQHTQRPPEKSAKVDSDSPTLLQH